MSDSSEDKTEEPSERKLKKARDQGQVAKSREITMAASLTATVMVLMGNSESFLVHMKSIFRNALTFQQGALPMEDLYRRMYLILGDVAWVVLPLLLVAALAATVAGFAQVGFVLAFEAVGLKIEKINPADGLQKLFSKRSLITLFITMVKASVIGWVMWDLFMELLPLGAGSAYLPPKLVGTLGWTVIGSMLWKAVLLAIVLGPMDYAVERWLFMSDQKMGKSEVKQDYKEAEGDPVVKGMRKQLAREMAREDPKKAVPAASVVVMNPTHYAVALYYSPEEGGLPTVIAKGMDEEALYIRRLAEEHGVPVVTNPPLARALHKMPMHAPVPEALFEPVAAVLRWVDDLGAPRPANR